MSARGLVIEFDLSETHWELRGEAIEQQSKDVLRRMSSREWERKNQYYL